MSDMMDRRSTRKKKKLKIRFGLIWMVVILMPSGLILGSSNLGQSDDGQSPFQSSVGFSPSVLVQSESSSVDVSKSQSPSELKAFFFSFVLPGAGEYYAGSKKMAKIFLSSEILLWTTYLSFRIYGNWKRGDYQQLAVSHARVNLSGKDHDYFVNIENYNNIREYNEAKLQQRQFDEVYPETAYYHWQWDSESSRQQFENLRIASDKAYHRSLFVIGGVIVNHIISGIDALRIARKNRTEMEDRIHLGVAGLPEGGMVVFLWKFF